MTKGLTIPDLLRTFGNWRTNSKSSTCFFGLSTVSFPTKDAQIQINQTSIEPVIDGFIGFYLYLPFIVIDLVVSCILLALGMMMMSPITLSVPLKLILFIAMDGWGLLSKGLINQYLDLMAVN